MASAVGKAALKQGGDVQTSGMFARGTGSLVTGSLCGDYHSPGHAKSFSSARISSYRPRGSREIANSTGC
jgi:hypothetical protein